MAGLEKLPDELVLEIFTHFACTQSRKPQSIAFKQKEKEITRQRENREKQLVLYALCLTSRRLRIIATPILYSSFVSCTTLHSFRPLQLFHRAICSQQPSTGHRIRLAECLQYVENRSSDYLGNSLKADVEGDEGVLMVSRYFSLLAEIVKFAPNLKHLNVVSLETGHFSFWRHILPDESSLAPGLIASHGLRKLQSIAFSVQTGGFLSGSEGKTFRQIFSALSSIPTLTDLRASGVVTSGPAEPPLQGFHGVHRIDVTECIVSIEEIAEVWEACEDLRHITCHWSCYYQDVSASCLYPALMRHAKTLQSLHLDLRYARIGGQVPKLGSLRAFTELTSLSLCETALGFRDRLVDYAEQTLEHRLSSLLPPSLQTFNILMCTDYRSERDAQPDDIRALWDLAADVKQHLPRLRTLRVLCGCALMAPKLTEAFHNVGVAFDLVDESTLRARV